MKKWKSNLDERQEQILLKIEHNGCWIAFWSLLVVLFAQEIIYGVGFRYVAGEWIVFMILALYLEIACLRKGIWDRRLKPNFRTNLVVSLITAVVFGAIVFAAVFQRFPDKLGGVIASAVISAAAIFVLCLMALLISARIYRRRERSMEAESEEETDVRPQPAQNSWGERGPEEELQQEQAEEAADKLPEPEQNSGE